MGGALPDWEIERRQSLPDGHVERLIITPFTRRVKEKGKISYGLTSYGYDVRCGDEYLIFSDIAATEIDPLTLATMIDDRLKEGRFVRHRGPYCIIPPNSFVLAESLEHVQMPRDCTAIVMGRSTYARCGICLNMTPLEPEWRGTITIEIANLTRLPSRVHSLQGIGQVIFIKGIGVCRESYADKPGASYQDQRGLTLPRA